MKNKSKSSDSVFRFLSSLSIVAVHTAMFCYVLFYRYNRILTAPLATGGYLMTALYIAGLIFVFNIMGALKVGYNRRLNIILSQIISLLLVNILVYLQLSLVHRAFLPIHQIVLMTMAQICAVILWTTIVYAVIKRKFPALKMLLVYGDKKAEDIVYKLLEREDRYMVCESVRFIEDDETGQNNIPEIEEKILGYGYVVICRVSSAVRNDLLKFCYQNNVEVYIQPRLSDIIVRGAKDLNQFDSPLVVCRNCSLSPAQRFFKRFFDIVFASVAVVITSPLMLITALCIKIYDGGPVFFKQKRVTLDEKVFDIYKFRSMVVDAEKEEKAIPACENDPRITPVGRVIRKMRIDELPQLFNIIKGDMSIVGPRPERVEHHKAYTEQIPEFPYRCKVKAGLTGYAQVMGRYNTSPYDKLLLDLMYIQKFSFFLDMKLILLTVKVIFMKESTQGFKK